MTRAHRRAHRLGHNPAGHVCAARFAEPLFLQRTTEWWRNSLDTLKQQIVTDRDLLTR
jgi:hypothetical protein